MIMGRTEGKSVRSWSGSKNEQFRFINEMDILLLIFGVQIFFNFFPLLMLSFVSRKKIPTSKIANVPSG